MNAHPEFRDEIAAYALGALQAEEATALESHMSECGACRGEFERLRVGADALALAVPQYDAPPEVQQRLLSTVRSEAQLLRAAEAPVEERRRRRWRLRGWFGGMPGLAVSALAVTVLILAIAGVFSSGTSVSTFRGQVTIPGATAALQVQGGRGELVLARMPQPPPGRIYEVWEQRASGAPQPTNALFGVTSSGSASVSVPGSLSGVKRVLVTDEPLGGSTVPTRTPVIVVSSA